MSSDGVLFGWSAVQPDCRRLTVRRTNLRASIALWIRRAIVLCRYRKQCGSRAYLMCISVAENKAPRDPTRLFPQIFGVRGEIVSPGPYSYCFSTENLWSGRQSNS